MNNSNYAGLVAFACQYSNDYSNALTDLQWNSNLFQLNKDARVTHAHAADACRGLWVWMGVSVCECVWVYCNLLAFVGDELCVDLRWLPLSLCSPWLPLGRPLIKLSSKEIPSSQCMTLSDQLKLLCKAGRDICSLQLISTHNTLIEAHCTLHCFAIFFWHFDTFPATRHNNNNNSICQQQVVSGFSFGFGFSVYFHLRSLSARIRPVVQLHN